MATKTKKKTTAGPVARQVAAESTLKFGPQRATLSAATQQALSDYQSDRKVNQQTAAAVIAAADAAQPKVQSAFQTASAANDAAHARAAADLSKLGSAADVFKGEADAQSQGASQRLASAIQEHANNLADVKVRAIQGRAGGNVAAKQKLSSSLAKIGDQLQELGVEKGAFDVAQTETIKQTRRKDATTRRGQDTALKASEDASRRAAANSRRSARTSKENAAASRRQSERNSERSAGLDPDTGMPIPGGKLDPAAKVKAATPAQASAAQAKVAAALAQVKPLAKHEKRGVLAQGLLTGTPTITKDPDTGATLPTPIPGLKKTDQFYASLALDVAYDGKVSKKNLAEIKRRGLTPQVLGLPTKAPATLPPVKIAPFTGIALPGQKKKHP